PLSFIIKLSYFTIEIHIYISNGIAIDDLTSLNYDRILRLFLTQILMQKDLALQSIRSDYNHFTSKSRFIGITKSSQVATICIFDIAAHFSVYPLIVNCPMSTIKTLD
ncbi:hypothetical protein, partial [Microcoleus sp. MON2_D5]|uniref:hypothetical protein n=1 Tax=Microcoleus sp. MON2_D5 TaxID=2818833 RepID=UPI002FD3414D